MTSRPPFRTSSSRHIRAFLSRLPKLPEGSPPPISRSIPGQLDPTITSNGGLKAVDDDFARAVRLEVSAEKFSVGKMGKKESKTVQRFPFVRMPSLDVRMVPKKLLVLKEKEHSQIFLKNRNQRSELSLVVITSRAAVHRFAVVRTGIKRKIAGALDLIVRRGALPVPEDEPKQPGEQSEPEVKDHKLGSKKPRILLHNPALADPKTWILPDWAYFVYPRAEVFRMPLPDLVDQLHLGLQRMNPSARAWQAKYVSPETGEFIPLLSKPQQTVRPPPEPKPWDDEKFGLTRQKADLYGANRFRGPSRYLPDVPPNVHIYPRKQQSSRE